MEDSSSATKFYEMVFSIVWWIKAKASDGIGFCVIAQGLIMTFNHVVIQDNRNNISCYNLKSNIEVAVKIVKRILSWDMTLLRLEVGSNETFDYVKMGNDKIDQVFCGQDVLFIENPNSHTSSLMMRKVTYPFDDYDTSKLLDLVKKEHELPPSVYDKIIQSHGTIGSMWRESGLDPNLPIIQTTRLNASRGASGNSIFSKRGSVLDMVFGGGECQINMTIHFQAINHFINLKVDDGEVEGSRFEK